MGLQERISPEPLTLPRPMRVLIVEDHPLVATAACDMLESIGGTPVATAATVREALRACAAIDFDVALLDVDLAGVSSVPVAARLARAGKPYLVVTGADRVPDGFGPAAVLSKPYPLRALRDALVATLP